MTDFWVLIAVPGTAAVSSAVTWWVMRRQVSAERTRRVDAEARARIAEDRARHEQQRGDILFRALMAGQVAGSDLPPRGEGLPELAPTRTGREQDGDEGTPSGGALAVTIPAPPRHRYRWPVAPSGRGWARGVWRVATRLWWRATHRPTVHVRRVRERDLSPWEDAWSAILPPERRLAAEHEARTRFRHAAGRRDGRWTPGILRVLRASLPRPVTARHRRVA